MTLFTFTRHGTQDCAAFKPEDVTGIMEIGGECFVYVTNTKEGIHAQENFVDLTARWTDALGLGAKPAKTRGRKK